MNFGGVRRRVFTRFGAFIGLAMAGALLSLGQNRAFAQPVDCTGLAARIAALGQGSQQPPQTYGNALQKQRADLDRAIQQARGLGCDRPQFLFFNSLPPQCPSLNAQIRQLQASLAYYQAGGDNNPTARQRLIASYNAYCRTQAPAPGQQAGRDLLDQLAGLFSPNQYPSSQVPPAEDVVPMPGEDFRPRGGSQALCVRSCDGGFFPLSVSASRGDSEQLTGLCQALCPNAEVSVYTRAPYQDIKTAVSLDGTTPYADLPNAFRFQKTFDSTCSCKPPGQSWAQALAPAEQLLGRVSKSDIVVTPEKSLELARPKLAPASKASSAAPPPAEAAEKETPAQNGGQAATEEVTGPDGVKRRVRIIVPPL